VEPEARPNGRARLPAGIAGCPRCSCGGRPPLVVRAVSKKRRARSVGEARDHRGRHVTTRSGEPARLERRLVQASSSGPRPGRRGPPGMRSADPDRPSMCAAAVRTRPRISVSTKSRAGRAAASNIHLARACDPASASAEINQCVPEQVACHPVPANTRPELRPYSLRRHSRPTFGLSCPRVRMFFFPRICRGRWAEPVGALPRL